MEARIRALGLRCLAEPRRRQWCFPKTFNETGNKEMMKTGHDTLESPDPFPWALALALHLRCRYDCYPLPSPSQILPPRLRHP